MEGIDQLGEHSGMSCHSIAITSHLGTQQDLVVLACTGVQVQARHDVDTKVEDPESPKGNVKGPAIKRQRFVVMRHGERIDEVAPDSPQHSEHISNIACSFACMTCQQASRESHQT